eukprot:364696-Chlamydomonas_euryale.AAC.6
MVDKAVQAEDITSAPAFSKWSAVTRVGVMMECFCANFRACEEVSTSQTALSALIQKESVRTLSETQRGDLALCLSACWPTWRLARPAELRRSDRLRPFEYLPFDKRLNWKRVRGMSLERMVRSGDTVELMQADLTGQALSPPHRGQPLGISNLAELKSDWPSAWLTAAFAVSARPAACEGVPDDDAVCAVQEREHGARATADGGGQPRDAGVECCVGGFGGAPLVDACVSVGT